MSPQCADIVDVWGKDGKAMIVWQQPHRDTPQYYVVNFGVAEIMVSAHLQRPAVRSRTGLRRIKFPRTVLGAVLHYHSPYCTSCVLQYGAIFRAVLVPRTVFCTVYEIPTVLRTVMLHPYLYKTLFLPAVVALLAGLR